VVDPCLPFRGWGPISRGTLLRGLGVCFFDPGGPLGAFFQISKVKSFDFFLLSQVNKSLSFFSTPGGFILSHLE